jgi:ABC-type transport system involved in multi-copper enzyme maturation permease subunit
LIAAAAIFLGELTAGQEARTIVNLGLAAVLFFGVFISIFVGVSLVSKEIEKRTIFAVFSKAIGRGEFIVGKYFGLCLTLFVDVLVMGIGVSAALLYVGGRDLLIPTWCAIFLIFCELTILIAVAELFSSFSTPALSALLAFFVFIIGHFSLSLRDLAERIGSQFAKFVFAAIYFLMPNFSIYEFATNAAHGETPSAATMSGALVYAICYNAILLAITFLILRKRNFK